MPANIWLLKLGFTGHSVVGNTREVLAFCPLSLKWVFDISTVTFFQASKPTESVCKNLKLTLLPPVFNNILCILPMLVLDCPKAFRLFQSL